MKKSMTGLYAILVLLVIANACLDYSAVCAYFDIDLFTGLKVENFLALVVSFGCSLVLVILPRTAASLKLRGQMPLCIASLVGCLAIALVFAGLRAAADATSTTVGIDGSVQQTMTASDILFVAVMFCLSVGESAVSYFLRTDALREERMQLEALICRLEADLSQVDERVETARKLAQSRREEAGAAAKAAGETMFLQLLLHAGTMQNSFIGYADAISQSREEFEQRVSELVAPAKQNAEAFKPAGASGVASGVKVNNAA